MSGSDTEIVECHSLVLVAAVPALESILKVHPTSEEIHTTLVFPDISGLTLRDILSDIYDAIVQVEDIEPQRIDFWSNSLGFPTQPKSALSKGKPGPKQSTQLSLNLKTQKPQRNRKRGVIFDDYETSSKKVKISKTSKKAKSSKKSSVPNGSSGRRSRRGENVSVEPIVELDVGIKEEFNELIEKPTQNLDDDNRDFIDGEFINDDDDDGTDNANSSDDDLDQSETQLILQSIERHLKRDSVEVLENLLKDESENDDPEPEEFDLLDTLPPDYDTSPVLASDSVYSNLYELSDAILSDCQDNFGRFFEASSSGVYLKNDIETDTEMSDGQLSSLPLVPSALFVGIFAVQVIDNKNLAQPLVLFNKRFPEDKIFTNFLTLITKVTGVSVRTVLESQQLRPFKIKDRISRVKKYQAQFRDLSTERLQELFSASQKLSEEQNAKTKMLNINPLPAKENQLKFKLVQNLENENILDFLIVYGDSINSLVVQSYVKQSRTKAGKFKQLSTLINSLAAFCGLNSAQDLMTIKGFTDIVETNFDRICEMMALKVLRNKQLLLMPSASKRKSASCPECKMKFELTNQAERKKFESHKLTHVGCNCDITFTSDSQFRAHMKSVHIQKKKFKCAFGSCSQYFSNQSSLEKHYHSIHEKSLEDGVGVICAICGQTFVNQHYLKAHHLCYHKEFPCSQCGQIIYGKNAQEKHHRDVHATFDDHLCQHCGKGFKMKKYLHIHIINAHTPKQDKPFPCHLCEKGFNNHMKLTQHLDGVHYKRRPYKCRASGDVCNMAFSAQSTRKRHEKVAHKLDIRLPQGRKSTSKVVSGSDHEKN